MKTLSVEELHEVLDTVCMTVLDMPVSAGHCAALLAKEHMNASIDISGAWQGSVQVRASLAFLQNAASLIFLKDVNEVDRQDCIDTIAELTNMLGGTVKCLLPESCDLGLPLIVNNELNVALEGDWHYFDCDGQSVAIAVVGASARENWVA